MGKFLEDDEFITTSYLLGDFVKIVSKEEYIDHFMTPLIPREEMIEALCNELYYRDKFFNTVCQINSIEIDDFGRDRYYLLEDPVNPWSAWMFKEVPTKIQFNERNSQI